MTKKKEETETTLTANSTNNQWAFIQRKRLPKQFSFRTKLVCVIPACVRYTIVRGWHSCPHADAPPGRPNVSNSLVVCDRREYIRRPGRGLWLHTTCLSSLFPFLATACLRTWTVDTEKRENKPMFGNFTPVSFLTRLKSNTWSTKVVAWILSSNNLLQFPVCLARQNWLT